jgi:hypothetical protein
MAEIDDITDLIAQELADYIVANGMQHRGWDALEVEEVRLINRRKSVFLVSFSNGKKHRISVTEDRSRRVRENDREEAGQ